MSVDVIFIRVTEFSVGFFGRGFVQLTNCYKVEQADQGHESMKGCQYDEGFGAYREAS